MKQQRASLHSVEVAKQPALALRDLNTLTSLLAANQPRIGHEFYPHHRSPDLRPIAELLEMPKS